METIKNDLDAIQSRLEQFSLDMADVYDSLLFLSAKLAGYEALAGCMVARLPASECDRLLAEATQAIGEISIPAAITTGPEEQARMRDIAHAALRQIKARLVLPG